MTVRQIVAIGLRLFALWVLVFSFQAVSTFALASGDLLPFMLISRFVLGITAMVVLWKFSDALSTLIVPKASADRVAHLTHAGLFQVGCCLIGLLTITSALSEALRALGWILVSSGAAYADAGPQEKIALLAELAKLAVGAFLLLRSDRVTRAAGIGVRFPMR